MVSAAKSSRSSATLTKIPMKAPAKRFVVCLKNKGYQVSLERRKIYEVIPDPDAAKHRQIRVIDESGDDYLYPRASSLQLNFHTLDPPPRPVLQRGRPSRSVRTRASKLFRNQPPRADAWPEDSPQTRNFHQTLVRLIAMTTRGLSDRLMVGEKERLISLFPA